MGAVHDMPSQSIQDGYPVVDEELLGLLPPVVRAIVRALGFARSREFLAAYGGVNRNIPQYKSSGLGLTQEELARLRNTLQPHMDSNDRVWLPKADKLFQITRNAQIRKDRNNASIDKLARQYDLSSRQIVNICREDDDRQFDLF